MKNVKPLISLFMLTATSMVCANPQGFQSVTGDASISFSDVQTLEVTTGKQSIIQWDAFSIDTSETTRFVMPTSSSTVLNRVLGGELSQILGTLEANGKVFLINPKGVLVGQDAHVNTSSFIASSYDVLDNDFMKNGEIAFKGNSGSIVNLGTIAALDGDVVLIGLQVSNQGTIDVPEGTAALAAGTEIYLRPDNNEKILIRANLSDIIADVGVENQGLITALQTEIKADGNIYSIAIKESGKIDALTKCRRRNNKIYLVADGGAIETSGTLTAEGGEVRVLADKIALLSGSHINVSSENNGGNVLIGGDYKGSNPDVKNASYVRIEENVLIEADAFLEGNGGKVIVWADDLNSFFGTITARGGEVLGDGGFVEVSSIGLIVPNGDVNTLAAHGKTGTLLLDPCAVTITAPPTTESGFASVPICPTGINPVSFDFTGNATSFIYASRIQSLLSCTNVTIDASATGTATSGSITVLSPISWDTTSTLTLTANDAVSSSVQFEANVTAPLGFLVVNGSTVALGHSTIDLINPVNVNVNNINIEGTNLSIYGGEGSGASAQITGQTIAINLSGNILLQGGNGVGSYAAIKGAGSLSSASSINATVGDSISITAGNGVSSSAAITASNGSIFLQTLSGAVELTGSSNGSYANAYIATYTSGGIDILASTDVVLQAGVQPGANANIFTQGTDDYDCHINITTSSGDVLINGGGP
jgi:filamentous hemagglutinin family protein